MRHADVINLLLSLASAVSVAGGACLAAGRRRAGYACAAAAWLLAAVPLIVNGWLAEAPPFGNMYQVQVLLALSFLPAWLILRARGPFGWTAPYFVLASALPLVGALFLDKDVGWRRMPALQSPWFVPHVSAYMIAYALAAVGLALSITGMVRRATAAAGDPAAASHQTIRLAFPFMLFGLLSGALWADQAWAGYWSWDPKETWSLITCLGYAIYLHVWTRPRLRRYAQSIQICAFGALLVTFIVVNLLPRFGSPLHGYANGRF